MAIELEKIKPWDGQSGTGADNRGVIDRNFDKVETELENVDLRFEDVEDEIAQLAGEKVSSENIIHSVFERVDFSNNSPTLPDGYTIENGSLVFTKADGMVGSKTARIPLNIPNRWKAGKYISMRGASAIGNESTISLIFHNSDGVSMTNFAMGHIPKSGSRTSAIVNAYDSSTMQVKLNVSINSELLPTGGKVYLNDVVLTDVAINDFRGLIQVISNPVLLPEKADHGYESLAVAKTVKQVDDTVIELEQNKLKLEQIGDALFNPYDSDGVGVNVAYGTPSTSYTCPPIPFNDNNALVVINCIGQAMYNSEMVLLTRAGFGYSSTPLRISKVDGAEFIRLSTPLDNRFDARATYPAGAGYSLKTTDPIKFETDSLVSGADVVFKMNPKDSADYVKKDEFSKISDAFNGITEVIDAAPLVNLEDVAITKFGGGSSSVTGYVSSGFIDIEGVDKIEFFNTMSNAANAYSSLLFYPASGTINISTYTPIFNRAMPFTMYRDSFKDAKRIRASYLKSQEDKFYIRLTKGSGISYVDLSQRNISAPSLEWAQRNAPSSEVVQVGSFSVRKIADPLAITNARTIVEGYEPINRDLRKPVGKVHVTDSYVNTKEMYHIGKYTKKIYCTGDVYGHIGVADSWEDFLDNNITTISISPIRAGVLGVREMQNGELVVIGGNAPSEGIINPADGIYISDGWAENYKTNTPVNFILKQQWQSVRNAPQDSWGFHVVGNQVLVSEYSVSGATFENSYVYYSKDFGQTFSAIFDIETQFGNSNNRPSPSAYQHIHGCCIDPYWDRLWVFPGEGAVNGQCISYSDDEGTTWTHLSTDTLQKILEVSNVSQWMKYCAAHALDTGVIMGTDSQPNGIWRYNRVKKDVESGSVAPYLEEAKRYDIGNGHTQTITHIMGHLTRVVDSNNEYPVIVCSPMVGAYSMINAINQSGLVHISYDGVRFWEIWRETDPAFKAPENFKDNNMKAYAYEDGSIYIVAKYYDGTSIRNRVIVGRLPEAY